MKKVINILLSSIYYLYFGLLLIVFHPIQVFCFHVLGRRAHQTSVAILNLLIVAGWYLTGSSVSFAPYKGLSAHRPIIFIANHSSMFDIPPMIWFLRKYVPIFVSKIELGKGIPSISYNLRRSGAALINRKDPKQAMTAIDTMGAFITTHTFSAVIFPEGTRSKTGEMKSFAVGGVSALLRSTKNALVVPIAIENTRKFNPKGVFPLVAFTKMKWTMLDPIEPTDLSAEEIVRKAEIAIRKVVEPNSLS